MYELTVITWSGSGMQFRQAETYKDDIIGPVPRIKELLTVHPDGVPTERSFTCEVTGVQRVIKGDCETHVAVTGKIQE